MRVTVPFCDTPGQSVVVGVLAGLLGGVVGLLVGLEAAGVVALAALLAAAGDLGAHVLRGDDQFRAALRQLTDDR